MRVHDDPQPAPEADSTPQVVLRIPGLWGHPGELMDALPEGFSLDQEWMTLPDGSKVEFNPRPWDDEFLEVFAKSCKRAPSEKDQHIVENYTVQVCLAGPGGSLVAAKRMMDAGSAILKTGGGGVFIDNSGNAHGSDDWFDLTNDPDNCEGGDWGGVYWAFVATVGSQSEIWSMGMHVLGYRDVVMPRSGQGDEHDYNTLHEIVGYTYLSGRKMHHGDVIADLTGPRYEVFDEKVTGIPAGNAMHNPYGRWRLVPAGVGRIN
jgi:hypothetical protein